MSAASSSGSSHPQPPQGSGGSFWDGFKSKLMSLISGPDPRKKAQWNPDIEFRFMRLLGYLKSMKGSEPKLAHEVLVELLPTLELDTFHYGNLENSSREANETFNHVRGLLLELWSYLLFTLPHIPPVDSTTFYKAITLLMRRREFDTHYLAIDPKTILPRTAFEQNVSIAREYRNLLCTTHSFLLNKLDSLGNAGAPRPYALLVFGSKVLALNYFRLPHISAELIKTLSQTPRPAPPQPAEPSPSSPVPPAAEENFGGTDEHIPSTLLDSPASLSMQRPGSSAGSSPSLNPLLLPSESSSGDAPASSSVLPPEDLERIESLPPDIADPQDDFAVDPLDETGAPLSDEVEEDPVSMLSSSSNSSSSSSSSSCSSSHQENDTGKQRVIHDSEVPHETPIFSFGLPPGLSKVAVASEDPLLDDGPLPQGLPMPGSKERLTSGSGNLSRLVVQLNEASQAEESSEDSEIPPLTFLMDEWIEYHEALRRLKFDGVEEKVKRLPKTWLHQVGQRDLLFYMLGKALVAYVDDTTAAFPTPDQWSRIYGWEFLKKEAIYLFSINSSPSRPESEFFSHLLLTDPQILSDYMRMAFSRTNCCLVPAIVEVFSTFEGWLRMLDQHHISLPSSFDTPFFCKAVDIAFQFDHHQTLVRILSVIFYFAHMFPHQLRRELFGELLLRKYFFTLFLHWDVSVRNTFHQILVFKMLRATRSHLRGEGLKISELGATTSPSNPPPQILPLARSIVEDDEDTTDRILWAKIEAYVSMTMDQLRNPLLGHFPSSSLVYGPRALVEYKMYLSLYFIRENELATKPPRLLPITLAKLCLENREGALQAAALAESSRPSSSSTQPSSFQDPKPKLKRRPSIKERIKKRNHGAADKRTLGRRLPSSNPST